jgi:hypothetical protein
VEQEAAVKSKPRAAPYLRNREPLAPDNTTRLSSSPLSFKVGKGWINSGGELSDYIELTQLGGFLTFDNVTEVYKPGTTKVVEAPKDLVGWLQHHPFLKPPNPSWLR